MKIRDIYNSKHLILTFIFILGVIFKFGYMMAMDPNAGSLYKIHESVSLNLLEGKGFMVAVSGSPGEEAPLIAYPPGYSLFIALVYTIFGVSHRAVQITQILIGSFGCVLFSQAVWWAFKDKRIGVLSGIAMCLIPIISVQDVILNINACLPIFFIVLAIFTWFWVDKSGMPSRFILPGLCLGTACMFRSETLLLIPVFAFTPLLTYGRRKFLTRSLAVILGGTIVLAPWALRNLQTFGVLSPTGPGAGLYIVEMIGKVYPDQANGFAFEDEKILLAEGNEYTDLHWPYPYQRGRERMDRALEFIRTHPLKAIWAFTRNIPLAWFGQQLYISTGVRSLHTEIASGNLWTIIRENPIAVMDRGLGMLISLAMFILGIRGIVRCRRYWRRLSPFIGSAGYYFLIFIFLGLLGRYTIPAYIMLIPFTIIGLRKQGWGMVSEGGDC